MQEGRAANTFDFGSWLSRRSRRFWGWSFLGFLMLIGYIGSQFSDDDSASVSQPAVDASTYVDAPTRIDVAAVLYGTATCIDDPSCSVVAGVTVKEGSTLVIETTMYPDSDAVIPAKSACNAIAFEGIWDGPIQVMARDGRLLASGRAGNVPPCETSDSLLDG